MHANFSNTVLRTCGSKETYEKICEAFRPVVKEHIAVYGEFNDQRLTGDTKLHLLLISLMEFLIEELQFEFQLLQLKKDGKVG